jgi:hypothetical protein
MPAGQMACGRLDRRRVRARPAEIRDPELVRRAENGIRSRDPHLGKLKMGKIHHFTGPFFATALLMHTGRTLEQPRTTWTGQ